MFESLVSGEAVFPASMVRPDIEKTVCISGHRESKITPYQNNRIYKELTCSAVRLMLYRYIDMAVEYGYEIFISGLAEGVDLWSADYIVRKKQNNSRIKLISMMPFLRHAERYSWAERHVLAEIERASDYIVTVNENPDISYGRHTSENTSPDLYRRRNYEMVDRSSAVIAFRNENIRVSGTFQTLNYACRTGKRLYSFGMKDIHDIIDRAGTDVRSIGHEIAMIKNVFYSPH